MNRLLSTLTLIAFFFAQLFPIVATAQAAATELNDFEITVPAQVIVNEAFDMTVTALNEAGKKYEKYEGTINCEIIIPTRSIVRSSSCCFIQF